MRAAPAGATTLPAIGSLCPPLPFHFVAATISSRQQQSNLITEQFSARFFTKLASPTPKWRRPPKQLSLSQSQPLLPFFAQWHFLCSSAANLGSGQPIMARKQAIFGAKLCSPYSAAALASSSAFCDVMIFVMLSTPLPLILNVLQCCCYPHWPPSSLAFIPIRWSREQQATLPQRPPICLIPNLDVVHTTALGSSSLGRTKANNVSRTLTD